MQNDNEEKPDNIDYSPEAAAKRIRKMREEGNPTVQLPGWVGVAVLVVIGGLLWFGYQRLGVREIPVCVVNTSSDEPIAVYLDGKSLGSARRMLDENPELALMRVIDVGEHKLEARDKSGAVIASEKFVADNDSKGFLWTPLPDPDVKFVIQTTDYGESTGNAGEYYLGAGLSFQALPKWVTNWFRDNPMSAVVLKGEKRTHESALRFMRNQ